MSKEITVQEPSVGVMLNGMLQSIQSGQVTQQSVEVLKGMMDLYRENEKMQAERAFASALVDLQGETIRVQATKTVMGRDGQPRYKFAPYEEIMALVQPMLSRHGFSITFDTKMEDNARLTSVCTLTHKGGHSRSNQFAVRFTTPPGSSEAQGDMSTKSYAKRGALCDALNITIDHDDDARMIGKPISKAEAEDLEDRVKKCGADVEAFLKYAGAASFDAIPDDRYDALDALLTKKERGIKTPDEKRDADGNIVW